MYCDHAMETPVELLVYDTRGCVLCPRCAATCLDCGRIFHFEDLNGRNLCSECAAAELEDDTSSEFDYPLPRETEEISLPRHTSGCGIVSLPAA